ncbi:MAG: radical SAM protein [bacterium]|nr:radical SAM protein [bacterium]
MRILLINPALELSSGEVLNIIAPLGLGYLAAVLEKDKHEVKILDMPALSWKKPIKLKKRNRTIFRYSPSDEFLENFLTEFNPQLVGISNLVSPTEQETMEVADKIKKILPKTKVVVGGSNASVRHDYFIQNKNIDFVVVGEGEFTLRELVKMLPKERFDTILGLVYKDKNSKVKINASRPLIADLDTLPFPAWHLLPMSEYLRYHGAGVFVKRKRVATMIASRGCPNSCSFCTNEKIWTRKWRSRSVENVMAEVKTLKKLYKTEEIQFVDNNISVRKEPFMKLCRLLKKEKLSWLPSGGIAVSTLDQNVVKIMAESGCYALQFGIEHGDLGIQKRIGKIVPLESTKNIVQACHEYGIWAHGNFIVGLPGETKDTAYKSLEYAIHADLDSISFFTALPLPGSKVYREVIGDKKIDPNDLRFYVSKAKCSELSNNQIRKIIKNSFQKFILYRIKKELNPLIIWQRIRRVKSFDDVRFYFVMFKRFVKIQTEAI